MEESASLEAEASGVEIRWLIRSSPLPDVRELPALWHVV